MLMYLSTLTVVNCESNCANTGAHHGLLVIVELDCLMVKRESFEFIVIKEVNSLLVQLESEALQE